MITKSDRYIGCLLGLACADAVGTTVEFSPRGTFTPLTDMVGDGPFHLQVGEWTDDTSMALCLAQSLIHKQGFDAVDQMERYCNWMRHGYMSSNGVCFDIGNTVSQALNNFLSKGEPYSGSTDPWTAGNGSIMRLAPVSMFYGSDVAKTIHFSGESSKTTHGAEECVDACKLMGAMLYVALRGGSKDEILATDLYQPATPKIQAIAAGAYQTESVDRIRGSGYVVDSLKAALWCFARTDSFRDAVLQAANLGDDADTTAAVCGQIAGAFYGQTGIPSGWRAKVVMRAEIEEMALALLDSA
ncbi:MAG: ADP-ribosylglycohydrolase family protein [Chloroflexota bacterium]